MLVGTRDPAEFEAQSPRLENYESGELRLRDVVFLQALFEIRSQRMCEMLPPALHPTLPPVAGLSVYAVPDSEWGAFCLAQLRIECRSGLRPRGLLVSAVTDNPAAGKALTERFGFRIAPGDGEIALERGYDETRVRVEVEGRTWLAARMRGPQRIGEGDTQFVSSLHPARTPSGLRLLQIDLRHEVHRAERAPFDLERFEASAWGESRIEPASMLPGVVGLTDVTIDPIRFVCRPDVLAFEGTETVGGD